MKPTYNEVPSWNDLVFENRNKAFGAYRLREDYDRNIVIAAIICAAIGAVIFLIPIIANALGLNHMPIIKIKPPITFDAGPKVTIIRDKRIVKPKRVEITAPKPDVIPQVTTQLVVDIPDAPKDIDTAPTGNDSGVEPSSGGDDLVATVETPIAVIEPKKVHDVVEIMPAYDGGLESMYRFLSKKLRYPTIDRRIGTEGTVYVRFIIDEFGIVTNVEVVKGISATIDKEAVRVISMMPKWKPGMQNHEAVSVRMILPVKFKLTT